MNGITKSAIVAGLSVTLLLGSGCASVNTAIEKRNLQVSTQMSETIFLDPVSAAKKTVFVQIRNTTDKSGLQIESPIKQKRADKGYQVVTDPEQAHYILQANILKVGKSTPQEASGYLNAGFGGALAGGALGGMSSGKAALGGSVIGAAVGIVGNALVKDVYYSMVTDIKLQAKSERGVVVTSEETAVVQQGAGSQVVQTSTATSEYQSWTTRVVSSANQVNLEFAEAEPELVNGLSRSISGIF